MPHADPQKAKEYFAAYYAARKAKYRERSQAYYEANKQSVLNMCQKYYEKTKEQQRDRRKKYNAQWVRENKHKNRLRAYRQVARRRQARPAWLSPEDCARVDGFFAIAASLGMTVDHIIPVQGKTVCGLHVPWNFQFLTRAQNSAKGNRLVEV